MTVDEFFQSIYIVCKSSNSFGGKLKPDKVEEFKKKAAEKAEKKSEIAGFLVKYEFKGASISFIPPNSVIIIMKDEASQEDVKNLLNELLE